MNNLKFNNENMKKILGAVIGMIFIVLYFVLTAKSPPVKFLCPGAERQDIISHAESFFQGLPGDPSRYEQVVSTGINNNLLRYAQYYRGEHGEFPDVSAGYWDVRRQAGNYSQSDPDTYYSVRFDFDGNLVGFKKREKDLETGQTKNLTEDGAHLEVIYFLASLNIDSKSLVTANKKITEKDKKLRYRFTFKNKLRKYPGLLERYVVEISGSSIIYFRLEQTYDPAITGELGKDYSKEIARIIMIFTWITLCFIIMAQFIKKLRRDELEFKRAFILGIFAAISMFFLAFIRYSGGIKEGLIFGAVTGLAAVVGILIVYPAAESQCRRAWSEKLAVTDLLFQGKVWVREIGAAILHSFFIAGMTLLFFGISIWLTGHFNLGSLEFPGHLPGVFRDLSTVTAPVFKNIIFSFFVGFVILFFWPGYIKTRFPKKAVLLLLTLTFIFSGLYTFFFRPVSLSFLIVAPIAFIWAVIVLKFDMLTVFLSLFGVAFFLDLALVSLMPEDLFRLPGMLVIIGTAFVFLLGIYLIFRTKSAKDYEDYVPDYVSRIAEKERLLKELEIARNVQMRFLPQQVPEFPNLEIVSLCRPAMEVGGDYYDFIRLDERYMSILIGDVSGKGVSAAFYMTMTKGIIKTLARQIREPAALLAEANEIFYENAPRDTFITIIYGVFDLREKTLTIASAGHNPLIVYKRKTKKIETCNPGGIALGFRSGESFTSVIEEETLATEEGDILVFYTDGVTEAMNIDQEIFGEQRLIEVIKQNSDLPPRKIEESIMEAVADFSGEAPQHDDFTMVIVKIKP